MKKHLLVLVVLALLPAFLFAQGGKEATASSGPVTLTIWGRDIADTSSDHIYMHDLLENFQKQNPDIKLDYIALGDPGLADKTKITMASGVDQLPEIIQSWGGSVMGGYADAGRL
ncbi:MAG: extracellular solute-binding protein, partial [Sphaerochaeta sp.]|nr:extracellular solute-binding protein [Sphaerochaeta sp.]